MGKGNLMLWYHIMASSSFIGRIVSLVDLSMPPVSNSPCPNMGKGSYISWRHQILCPNRLWYLYLSYVRDVLIKLTGMHCSPGWLLHDCMIADKYLLAPLFAISAAKSLKRDQHTLVGL